MKEYDPVKELERIMKEIELMQKYYPEEYREIMGNTMDMDESRLRYRELVARIKKFHNEE